MTHVTRTLTRDELKALDVPYTCVHTEVVGEWRHGTREIGVFEPDGRHWSAGYLDSPGADEPCDPWNYATEIAATEVRLAAAVVERWEPVDTDGPSVAQRRTAPAVALDALTPLRHAKERALDARDDETVAALRDVERALPTLAVDAWVEAIP